MMEVGGLAILFAWLLFGVFVGALGYLVLRHEPDVKDEARRSADGSRDSSQRRARSPK